MISIFSISLFVLIIYLIYWGVSISTLIKNRFLKKYGVELGHANHVVFQKVAGFLILGVAGLLFSKLLFGIESNQIGLEFNNLESTFIWSISSILFFTFLNYFIAKTPQNLSDYPQIRINNWTYPILIKYLISWVIFIFGYELLFRGVFLSELLSYTNVYYATAINTIVYSLVHFNKGKREMLGSIPLGVLLCYMTITTENIWAAVLLHSTQAVANNIFSIMYHPEMKILKRK